MVLGYNSILIKNSLSSGRQRRNRAAATSASQQRVEREQAEQPLVTEAALEDVHAAAQATASTSTTTSTQKKRIRGLSAGKQGRSVVYGL